MDRAQLLRFLEDVGAGSLESYLSQHGDDPLAALEERLQWAAWNFRDPEKAEEAAFLMQHHDNLRAVIEEGETSWHLRLKRAERGPSAAAGPPAPPPGLGGTVKPKERPGRTVAGAGQSPGPVAGGPTMTPPLTPAPAPVRAPGLQPAAPQMAPAVAAPPPGQAENAYVRGAPPPSISDLDPAGAPSPLSEQATEIRLEDNPLDREAPATVPPATARRPPKPRSRGGESYRPKSNMPSGLDRTIPDMDAPAADPRSERNDARRPKEGLGLGFEKTAYGDDNDDEPPRYSGKGFVETATDYGLNDPPSNISFLLLGVGLTIVGMGLLALAAAVVFGVVSTGGSPEAPPPPPPSLEGALPPEPGS